METLIIARLKETGFQSMIKFIKFKACILICMLLMLSCARDEFLSSSYVTSFELILDYFSEEEEIVSLEMIERIPYASSLISLNGKNKSLIILEFQNAGLNTWISKDKIRFKEDNGRIIQTIGLPNDLFLLNRPKINFEELLAQKESSYISYYSFRKPTLNNLKVQIKAEVLGLEKISILGREQSVILIREHLFSESINWKATNRYWVDPETKFIWKSVQSISPKLPPLEIMITKKPAN